MYNVILDILEELDIIKWTKRFNRKDVENALYSEEPYKTMGYSSIKRWSEAFRRSIKIDLNKPRNRTWEYHLLYLISYKKCNKCGNIKHHDYYTKNSAKGDGLDSYCKDCKYMWQKENKSIFNAHSAARRAKIRQAIPKWANLQKIEEIYEKCPRGMHVDHIIPLTNNRVCGLHTIDNLQYLTAKENLTKSNRFND